ncbi:MAG: hypothetical protein JOZ69_01035 [Myxococcales bacterium]|nr:hypothetical protein [Myxococcales bacterium]
MVRTTEPDFNLVECFEPGTNTCPIEPSCELKRALRRAREGFFAVLDAHTLADLTPKAAPLVKLWARRQHAPPD